MLKKCKILIIGPSSPPYGGIATYVDDMLKSNIVKEFDILQLNTARNQLIKKSLAKNYLLFQRNISKLVQIIIIEKPQIVHIHTSSYLAFWEKSVFLIISKFFFKKTIIHIHGAEFDKFYKNSNFIEKFIIKMVLNISDKVIVLSIRWKYFFLQIIDNEKISVIQNGIDCSKLVLFENHLRNEEFKRINILFLGNLVQRKGVYDILKSIPIVLSGYKNVQFIFAGSEERSGEIDELKKETVRQNIDSYVTFKSNFSEQDRTKLLIMSDVFVLPSYAEGLPISLLEAMAAGLPIISTSVGGIPEVITEGENGFLINPGDYMELANKIQELIEDPEIKKKMGKNNQEKIRAKYNWKIIANQLTDEYNKLLNKN